MHCPASFMLRLLQEKREWTKEKNIAQYQLFSGREII